MHAKTRTSDPNKDIPFKQAQRGTEDSQLFLKPTRISETVAICGTVIEGATHSEFKTSTNQMRAHTQTHSTDPVLHQRKFSNHPELRMQAAFLCVFPPTR